MNPFFNERYEKRNSGRGSLLHRAPTLDLSCMVKMIRFLSRITTKNRAAFLLQSACRMSGSAVLNFGASGALDMKRLLSLFVCAVSLFAAPLNAVELSGTVTFVTKRGQRPVVEETLVWLEPIATRQIPRIPPTTTQMTTRGKMLMPHVLAVPNGSTISFPNEDPISHNLFSLSTGNAFDLGLYRKGPGKSQKFDSPGVVNIYCNVHPNMSAVIHVMPTPYFVFADPAGKYSLDVPPGKYRVIAWNEQGGQSESTVDVTANGVAGNVALTLDSRNVRHKQHLNKEGKPYQRREY